ncbi:hypothetical protein SD70_23300 [Gordoniibacillus kamchatkensis]|uniref:Aspartyl-phosphate phosphatase Spo0E family protein n=1 Tax=Gordoniibacillus kamchatkensis TaxID=1590651 RepID=A0ABR5AD53_9BACL|nr:aspartyl-phosphate phosphatase Spo0E family protein [Paenibacillus sp. VKM B-2647]KIL38971.1 hypothetical protein SD70_23300 [Paenibacillus sp. VKM B-2647]
MSKLDDKQLCRVIEQLRQELLEAVQRVDYNFQNARVLEISEMLDRYIANYTRLQSKMSHSFNKMS